MILEFESPLSRQDVLRIGKLLGRTTKQFDNYSLNVTPDVDSNSLNILQSYGYCVKENDLFKIENQQNSGATISLEGKGFTKPSKPKRKGVSGKIDKRNL